MDSVLNLPARAIQVETSVHGQPVAGIVSTQDRGNTPTLLRSNTVLMQKVAGFLSLQAHTALHAKNSHSFQNDALSGQRVQLSWLESCVGARAELIDLCVHAC
jgi:hypothetical protein